MSDSSATTDTDTTEIRPFRQSPLSETDELQARFREQVEWYRLNAVRKLTPSDLELRQRRVDEEFTALFGAQKLNATTPSDLELRRLRVNKEYAALCYLNCNARKLKADALRQDGEKKEFS
jgi:hypothetical protein